MTGSSCPLVLSFAGWKLDREGSRRPYDSVAERVVFHCRWCWCWCWCSCRAVIFAVCGLARRRFCGGWWWVGLGRKISFALFRPGNRLRTMQLASCALLFFFLSFLFSGALISLLFSLGARRGGEGKVGSSSHRTMGGRESLTHSTTRRPPHSTRGAQESTQSFLRQPAGKRPQHAALRLRKQQKRKGTVERLGDLVISYGTYTWHNMAAAAAAEAPVHNRPELSCGRKQCFTRGAAGRQRDIIWDAG